MEMIKEFDPVEFGKTLKALRQKKGLTQMALGELIGVDQAVISGYENGKNAGVENTMKLAQALDTSIDYLCGISHDDRDITPAQWFSYTMSLIDNPPSYLMQTIPTPGVTAQSEPQRLPLVHMRKKDDRCTAIEFYGKNMENFFDAYNALKQSLKGNVDSKTYNDLTKTLFDSYSKFFTVGWSEYGNYRDGVLKEANDGKR